MGEEKYAFLMIGYDTPDIIKEIWNGMDENDLYHDEERPDDYGKERETHVTLVPCLDNDVDAETLLKMLRPLHDYRAMLSNVSLFDTNELYDVLKCDVSNDFMHESNKAIRDVFPSHSEFTEFHPHMTIAYLKKGAGKKYVRDIIEPIAVLEPNEFILSWYDDEGNQNRLTAH